MPFLIFLKSHNASAHKSFLGFIMNHSRMENDQVFDGRTRELWTCLTQYLNSHKKQYVRVN